MYPTPTQSVPGGFLLVFFGLLALVFAGLAGYAGWLACQTDDFTDAEKSKALWTFFGLSGTGLLIGISLISFGIRLAWKVGPYDNRDPKEPMLKW